MKYKLLLITLFACGLGWGQLSVTSTGTAFTQNFDGMTSSATASLPSGFKMISYSASPDWSSGESATAKAYGTSGTGVVTGTSAGGLINWANGVTASSTDRAIGFLNSGSGNTNPSHIILKFTNNTGVNITSLNIAFDYEKYRSGSRQCDWTFFHGSSSNPTTPATVGDQSYSADANNNVISNPPTSINKSFTLSSLSIANGDSYYLKWTYTPLNGGSNGQGIGVDNISITASAPSTSTTYTTTWSNNAPTASIDAIINGNLTTTTDLVCKDLTINPGKTLTIGASNSLTVAGNLVNDGSIVFESNNTSTGRFDSYSGNTITGTGSVTMERYIDGKRAFRFLAPGVNTSGSIADNWQQQVFITGSTTVANAGGFDVTETGAPSMFTFEDSGWTAIANTGLTLVRLQTKLDFF